MKYPGFGFHFGDFEFNVPLFAHPFLVCDVISGKTRINGTDKYTLAVIN